MLCSLTWKRFSSSLGRGTCATSGFFDFFIAMGGGKKKDVFVVGSVVKHNYGWRARVPMHGNTEKKVNGPTRRTRGIARLDLAQVQLCTSRLEMNETLRALSKAKANSKRADVASVGSVVKHNYGWRARVPMHRNTAKKVSGPTRPTRGIARLDLAQVQLCTSRLEMNETLRALSKAKANSKRADVASGKACTSQSIAKQETDREFQCLFELLFLAFRHLDGNAKDIDVECAAN